MKIRAMIAGAGMIAIAACGGSTATPESDASGTSGAESTGSTEPTAATPARNEPSDAASASRARPAAEETEWVSETNPNARFLVAIGVPIARDDSVRSEHIVHARRHAASTLRAIDGVELAPPQFDHDDYERQLAGRSLPGIFLECAIVHHDVDARGTHFAVSVTIIELGSEDVVATLQGRATAPGAPTEDSDELALEGALDSALRGLPQLLVALD